MYCNLLDLHGIVNFSRRSEQGRASVGLARFTPLSLSSSFPTTQRPVAGIALLPPADPHARDDFLLHHHRRRRRRGGWRLAAVLAVGAAELGAGVRVGILVPAHVAEVAPAERRRLLLPPPLLVDLHGHPLRSGNGQPRRR
uniref:Uncharacterized protein n=1 Tax=Arundo donax TaxID=35708 RepID=A0A0A9ESL3_ARUDO